MATDYLHDIVERDTNSQKSKPKALRKSSQLDQPPSSNPTRVHFRMSHVLQGRAKRGEKGYISGYSITWRRPTVVLRSWAPRILAKLSGRAESYKYFVRIFQKHDDHDDQHQSLHPIPYIHTWRRSRWAWCQSESLARREGVGSIPCVSMLASSTTYRPRRSQTFEGRGRERSGFGLGLRVLFFFCKAS